MTETSSSELPLEPIPGDTYALRAELKALGAVWDASGRVWRIAPEKLPLANALVANQALVPPPAGDGDVESLSDPFEQEAEGPRRVTLDKGDGATYEARDVLRAVGAHWDKNRRSWTIREDRAPYARAVLSSLRGGEVDESSPPSSPPLPPPPPRRQEPEKPVLSLPHTPSQGATRPMAADRIKLGGLWLNKSKDGREYLTGKLSPTVKILIFKNDFKTSDNQPSHVMYLAPVETDETQRQNTPAPDSFFGDAGESDGAGGMGNGGDFTEDDYLPAEEAPAPAAAVRPTSQRPVAARPTGNAREAAPVSAPPRPTNGNRLVPPSAATGQAARRPNNPPPVRNAPPPRDDHEDDLSDPFAE